MPRRIDLDARRAQLAEAVWRVILDRGIAAVSVRTVADQASVAVGSLRHVFPTRAELLAFSARLMVERARDRIRAMPPVSDPQRYALAVVEHLLPLTPDSRAELEINIALIAETPALPDLAGIRDEAYRQLGDGCLRLVEVLTGRPRDSSTVRAARRLHALVDGLALHLLMDDADPGGGWALDIVADELARLAGQSAGRPVDRSAASTPSPPTTG